MALQADARKRKLYEMIASQLREDNMMELAATIVVKCLDGQAAAPSKQLGSLVDLGMQANERQQELKKVVGGSNATAGAGAAALGGGGGAGGVQGDGGGNGPESARKKPKGIDFEEATSLGLTETPALQLVHTSQQRAAVRALCFSPDGSLLASGNQAGGVRLYDVNVACKRGNGAGGAGGSGKSVVRNFLGHSQSINDLAFHSLEYLATASDDCTAQFFMLQNASGDGAGERATWKIQESHAVQTLSIHPSGGYALLGTVNPVIRLYDLSTMKCFATQNAGDHHEAPITRIRYSPDGKYFASACKAGVLKLWDGRSNRVVNSFQKEFDTTPISTLEFTENGKYLLTGGRDSQARLWDLRNGKVVNIYEGADQTNKELGSCLSEDELRVYSCDESDTSIRCWDTKTRLRLPDSDLAVGSLPWCVAHSPTTPVLATGGADKKLKFFHFPQEEKEKENEGEQGSVNEHDDEGGGGAAADAEDGAAAGGGEAAPEPSLTEAEKIAAVMKFMNETASVVGAAKSNEEA